MFYCLTPKKRSFLEKVNFSKKVTAILLEKVCNPPSGKAKSSSAILCVVVINIK